MLFKSLSYYIVNTQNIRQLEYHSFFYLLYFYYICTFYCSFLFTYAHMCICKLVSVMS